MKKQDLRSNQSGLVSILVTLIIMILLSLIVLGFARIVRREQRQSLDSQLSTQAFYAAETGVNDAVNAIKNLSYTANKDSCAPDASGPLSTGNELDAAAGVAYTCLLVNQSPPSLVYDNIDVARSTVVPLTASAPLSSVTISWQDKDGGTDISGCRSPDNPGYFPPLGDWEKNGPCQTGVLRVDLVPSGGTFTRNDLLNNTFTAFLYPQTGPASGSFSYNDGRGFGKQGAIIKGKCDGSGARLCSVTIGGLGADRYHLRLKSIYKPSALTITATTAAGGPANLIGAQAIIDSTGKANDVLRRIQVRVPLHKSNDFAAEFAIESVGTLCKRISVAPGQPPTFDPAECKPTP